MSLQSRHDDYMRRALKLAEDGLGRVWPNPSVGCLLVKNDSIIAQARTGDGGRPHAEEAALEEAGPDAKGATAYITLEPCFHDRPGGSCTKRLINAGLKEICIAMPDPDPRTAGQGIAALKIAGIAVQEGICRMAAEELNAGFIFRVQKSRPHITLKMAASRDWKIAGGLDRWITGPEAREEGHRLRARSDAILVGSGTVLADDPMLTTRLDGTEHQIVRVVLDRRMRLSLDCRLVQTAADHPLWIMTDGQDESAIKKLTEKGCKIFPAKGGDLVSCLENLAGQGITRLLVEGGAQIYESILSANIADEIALFRSPKTIGAEGLSALKDVADGRTLFKEKGFKSIKTEPCGEDTLEIFRKKP